MVKEKPESVRIYDSEGYRLRAACVCVRDDSEQEVLLISAGRSKGYFIVPGGGIDPGEKAVQAAVREAHEEAGVEGRLKRLLGVFKNERNKSKTAVYVLVVEDMDDEWMEKSMGRTRRWFHATEALEHLFQNRQEQVPFLKCLKGLQ